MYIIHFYGSGFTTPIRFNYWILCETVLPGQGGVPRLAEVDFTDTDTESPDFVYPSTILVLPVLDSVRNISPVCPLETINCYKIVSACLSKLVLYFYQT